MIREAENTFNAREAFAKLSVFCFCFFLRFFAAAKVEKRRHCKESQLHPIVSAWYVRSLKPYTNMNKNSVKEGIFHLIEGSVHKKAEVGSVNVNKDNHNTGMTGR